MLTTKKTPFSDFWQVLVNVPTLFLIDMIVRKKLFFYYFLSGKSFIVRSMRKVEHISGVREQLTADAPRQLRRRYEGNRNTK